MNAKTKQNIRTHILNMRSFEHETEEGDVISMECVKGRFSGHIEYEGMNWDYEDLTAVDVLELIDEYF